jgi:hypothetical protein
MNKQLIAVAALAVFAASSQAAVTNTASFKLKATVQLADTVKTNGSVVTATYKTKSYKITNLDFTGDKKTKIFMVGTNFWVGTNQVAYITEGTTVGTGGEAYSYVSTTNTVGTNVTVTVDTVTQKENIKSTQFTTLSITQGTNSFTMYGLAEGKSAESQKKQAESGNFTGVGEGTYLANPAIVEGTVTANGSIKKDNK